MVDSYSKLLASAGYHRAGRFEPAVYRPVYTCVHVPCPTWSDVQISLLLILLILLGSNPFFVIYDSPSPQGKDSVLTRALVYFVMKCQLYANQLSSDISTFLIQMTQALGLVRDNSEAVLFCALTCMCVQSHKPFPLHL